MDVRKINEFSNHLYCVRETKVKFSMLRHPFTVFNNSCILNMKIRYVLAILNLPYTPHFLSFVLLVQKHRMLLQNHIAVKTVTCALHSKTARTSTKVSMKTKVLFRGQLRLKLKMVIQRLSCYINARSFFILMIRWNKYNMFRLPRDTHTPYSFSEGMNG